MLVHIFRGPARVFGFTEDATGANLPSQFSPWTAFKSIDLSRDGEPRAGVDITCRLLRPAGAPPADVVQSQPRRVSPFCGFR
jgi:hypothetical protein